MTSTIKSASTRTQPKTHLRWSCPFCGFIYNEDGKAIEVASVSHLCPARGRERRHLKPIKQGA